MDKVDRCEDNSPRHPLPSCPGADEGDHGTVGISAVSGDQLKCCVCDNYSPVTAHRRHLIGLIRAAESAASHRSVEPVPMQTAQDGWNDDIEIAAERLVRRITHYLGNRVTPLLDNAVPIHRDTCPLLLARPLRSVHTLITTCTGGQFTKRPGD